MTSRLKNMCVRSFVWMYFVDFAGLIRDPREITSIVAAIIAIITLIRFFRKMLSPEKLQTLVHAVNEFGGIMK